ncbi:hypothetical protein A3K86_05125 [Photobacterium jeanii]|uniref:NAD-dependent epimerase/dehydratase domain-containing protein n=1 Tax=Photobacterium jeanii TaxID=858640 RepID=A0A178KND8_9GAMM|nr:NAD-dependent epimerase/dehydratase family protein [Photobacterium jeanii]OAN18807.1 hypothetical protein A3K86_05125 [Photobacterium jeanii]PST92794.1 protein yeeZ precursor [Photobacterium jeanii]
MSICGCGWLGLPLAKHLVSQGFSVKGTKQTPEGAALLQAEGIDGYVLTLPLQESVSDNLASLWKCDVLVVNVPPGRGSVFADHYYDAILELVTKARAHGCKRVIFISSTSVYGELQGEITEVTSPVPSSISGQTHYQLEQALRTMWGDDLAVLRLSGLIGPKRHPVTFLAGREGITNGGAPVNLIHLDDCIQAITALINRWELLPSERTFHLAASAHPSRKTYYSKMAMTVGLPVPQFADEDGSQGKWINAQQTCDWLGLTLANDNLMAGMPELKQ